MTLDMYCTGDTVSGDGRKNVVLQPTSTQDAGVYASDDLRFSLDPSHPDFNTFVKNKDRVYTVTIS